MELAKYAATLDQLSGGRVILGVGVGGLIEEFQAMGIPFEQRGAISDETLRIVRKLWTEETVTHHGTRWNFDDVKVSPKPLQKPHVPILVGGASKAAQVRAGKLGAGFGKASGRERECQYV